MKTSRITSGFNGLPGGARDVLSGGVWVAINAYSFWWGTTEFNDSQSYCTGLYSGYDYLRVFEPYEKGAGMSIRCIAD